MRLQVTIRPNPLHRSRTDPTWAAIVRHDLCVAPGGVVVVVNRTISATVSLGIDGLRPRPSRILPRPAHPLAPKLDHAGSMPLGEAFQAASTLVVQLAARCGLALLTHPGIDVGPSGGQVVAARIGAVVAVQKARGEVAAYRWPARSAGPSASSFVTFDRVRRPHEVISVCSHWRTERQ